MTEPNAPAEEQIIDYPGVQEASAPPPPLSQRLRDPRTIIYRSPTPILAPETDDERAGIVPNVVFPTGIDLRENGRVDIYYGMADAAIGVARLDLTRAPRDVPPRPPAPESHPRGTGARSARA
jgi:hypothetical protein